MNEMKKRRTPKRCGYCKHWQRNDGFPNRLGTCQREFTPTKEAIFPIALNRATTHEKFGCTGFDFK